MTNSRPRVDQVLRRRNGARLVLRGSMVVEDIAFGGARRGQAQGTCAAATRGRVMPNEQPGASAGRVSEFVRARTLIEYPRGGHRWSLLLLTMLASILASFEFQLALLLPYLHMSRIGYGYLITSLILLGGISAFYGGPLADRYGRVLVIDVCLAMVIVLLFANVLITNVTTFVIVRAAMGIVAGLMAGALAALVRDMSPRLTRALSFALLTIGPVG